MREFAGGVQGGPGRGAAERQRRHWLAHALLVRLLVVVPRDVEVVLGEVALHPASGFVVPVVVPVRDDERSLFASHNVPLFLAQPSSCPA